MRFTMQRLLASTLLLLPCHHGAAQAYQFEVGGQFSDKDGIIDQETWLISGDFYFNPVDDSKGPYREAAFLNRSSSLGVFYADTEVEPPFGRDGDGDTTGFNVRVVDAVSGIVFNAGYATGDIEDDDTDQLQLGAGIYLDDISSLEFDYYQYDNDFIGDNDTYQLSYRRVNTLQSRDYFTTAAELSYNDPDRGDSSTTFALHGDYYFTQQASVGGSLGFASGDDSDATVLGLRTEVFLRRTFSVYLRWDMIDYDDIEEDDMFTVGLKGRF